MVSCVYIYIFLTGQLHVQDIYFCLQIGSYKADYEGSFVCNMYTAIIQSSYGFICTFTYYIVIRKHCIFNLGVVRHDFRT